MALSLVFPEVLNQVAPGREGFRPSVGSTSGPGLQ